MYPEAVRLAQDPLSLAVCVEHDAIPSDRDEATRKQIKGSSDALSWVRGHKDLLIDHGSAHEMRNDVPQPIDLCRNKRPIERKGDGTLSAGVFRDKGTHLVLGA